MSDWLVVGAAPTIHRAMEIMPSRDYTIISANSGLKLFPQSNYWSCYDWKFSRAHYELSRKCRREHGTKLVTISRPNKEYLTEHLMSDFDVFCDVEDAPEQPTLTRYGKPAYSGQLATEFACRNGATRIVLIGMDGYRPTNNYFDEGEVARPEMQDWFLEQMVKERIQPRMQALAVLYPMIEFLQIGNPVYYVNAANWKVVLTEDVEQPKLCHGGEFVQWERLPVSWSRGNPSDREHE